MRYTYNYVKPSATPPFKTRIRWTNGRFSHITDECGAFGFRYAVFLNRASEVWVPVHDLTPESRAIIEIA